MKIAAQMYTVREFTKTPDDIKITLKKIKAIGYDSMHISAFGAIDVKLLREFLDETQIGVCATHVPLDRIVNDTEALIEEHRIMNCSNIGLGAMDGTYRGSREGYDNFIKTLKPAVEKINDAGMKFHYHNHRFEFEKVDGSLTGMDYLAQNTDPEKFKFLVDCYWVQAGGASPVKFLTDYKQRISIVHFKDMGVVADQNIMTAVGEGNMDYVDIYSACIKNNVEFAAVEQDNCNGVDPFVCLESSYKYIASKLQ